MDAEEARTLGRRLRQVREDRGKSLEVIAGLAGMSLTKLWRIEHGKRALGSRAEIVALANALQISPTELTRLPVPAPANGNLDVAVIAVRRALWSVSRHRLAGQVLPVQALRSRVQALLVAGRQCRQAEVGVALPGLIQDLHTSIAAGRDVAELLDLAVVLHTQGSHAWLAVMGASLDLRSLAALLARQAAERRDTPTALGLAAWGDALAMLAEGDFDLARVELDSVTVPTTSSESMQLAGMLGLCSSLVAAADKRPADVVAAVEYAGELAQHTGEGNAWMLGFGPTNVGMWQMSAVVEAGDHERAAVIAEGVNPDGHPNPSRQAAYWITYGRALSRLRRRQDDAVQAFRRAEMICPPHLLRNPLAREAMGELLFRTRRDSPAGQELREMAKRAKLLLA